MAVAIIDSGGANISSVRHALNRLGAEAVFTADADVIRGAERVILPGVGAARAAMQRLSEHGLVNCIRALTQPVLGICLGMQLLFESSEEGDTDCLGIIPGRLRRFLPGPGLRVPHMGWNQTREVRSDALTSDLEAPWFYFVHSYCAPLGPATLASCTHGTEFSAIVRQGNFHGTQFHPERSAKAGARILENFLSS
jgi:glutamine amidotransferase